MISTVVTVTNKAVAVAAAVGVVVARETDLTNVTDLTDVAVDIVIGRSILRYQSGADVAGAVLHAAPAPVRMCNHSSVCNVRVDVDVDVARPA